MVLIESVGFGVRERDLFLYFWDLRDGAEWSGWWVTPDFCGNNDYILHNATDSADPGDVAIGDWRSPHFENTQLRRKLTLGFRAEGTGADRQLCACGNDASTAIIPDGVSKVVLSDVVFREDGMHHGRPRFRAAPAPPAVVAAPRWSAWLAQRPEIAAGLCIGLGFAVGVAASRRRA